MTLNEFIARHRHALLVIADRPGCAASPAWTQLLLGWFAVAAGNSDAALTGESIRSIVLCMGRLLMRETVFLVNREGGHLHIVPLPSGAAHAQVEAALADLIGCLAAWNPDIAAALAGEVHAQIRHDLGRIETQLRQHTARIH